NRNEIEAINEVYPSCSKWSQEDDNDTLIISSPQCGEATSQSWRGTEEQTGKWVIKELSQGVEVNWQFSEPPVSGEVSTYRKRGVSETLHAEPPAVYTTCSKWDQEEEKVNHNTPHCGEASHHSKDWVDMEKFVTKLIKVWFLEYWSRTFRKQEACF